MSSSVEALSSSCEGLLADLSGFSLSPRLSLLKAIRSNQVTLIEEQLVSSASKYGAFELAGSLYVMLRGQNSSPAAVAQGILILASRLITYDLLSESAWTEFLALIKSPASHEKVAQFLEKNEPLDRCLDKDALLREIIKQLSVAFSANSQVLLDSLLNDSIPEWIDSRALELVGAEKVLSSLILAYHFCTPQRQTDYDDAAYVQEGSCLDFLVEAMSKNNLYGRKEQLLSLLGATDTRFVTKLQKRSFQLLKGLNLSIFGPQVCLDILDNPLNLVPIKLELVTAPLQAARHLPVSLLFTLFSRLTKLSAQLDDANRLYLTSVLEVLHQVAWTFDLCPVTVFAELRASLDRCINGDLPTLLQHPQDKDVFTEMFMKHLTNALKVFVASSRLALMAMPVNIRVLNVSASIKVKTQVVSMLFFLYNCLSEKTKKHDLFTYLDKELTPIQISKNPSEPTVRKVLLDSKTLLCFGNEHVEDVE